jgi:hypothetical protein
MGMQLKRGFFVLALILILSTFVLAENPSDYAKRVVTYYNLPATCNPANGDILKIVARNTGLYICTATNTWTHIDNSGMLNVKDCGAKSDGIADDKAAINACFAAAAVASGPVYFPPGNYKLAAALTIPNGISIKMSSGAIFSGAGSPPVWNITNSVTSDNATTGKFRIQKGEAVNNFQFDANVNDYNGNTLLQINPQVAAANWMQWINGAAGNGFSEAIQGTDAKGKWTFGIKGSSTEAESNAETGAQWNFCGDVSTTCNNTLQLVPRVNGLDFVRVESSDLVNNAPRILFVGPGVGGHVGGKIGTQALGHVTIGANMAYNRIVEAVSVASAVLGADLNHLTVTNATTPNGPIIGSDGVDANSPIYLTPKGTGHVVISNAANFNNIIAAASLGTAAGTDLVLDAGNLIKVKVSSERYKNVLTRNYKPEKIDLDNFFKKNPIVFSYKESPDMDVIGFSAEDLADIPFISNKNADGEVVSNRSDAIMVYLFAELKRLRSEVAALKGAK